MSEIKSHPEQTAPEPFATPELFREFFTLDSVIEIVGETAYYDLFGHLEPKQRPQTLANIIHLDPSSEQFYAECAYLNHWNAQLDHALDKDGVDIEYYPIEEEDAAGTNGVEIDISHGSDLIAIQYCINPDLPDAGYQVQIIDPEGNIVYWREPGQNPHTEWAINCMADDPEYVNAAGELAFTGDHTNL